MNLAKNPSMPKNILKEFAYNKDCVYWIPNNPKVSADILEILADTEEVEDAVKIAKHPLTNAKSLKLLLCNHRDFSVEKAIAENPNAPEELLESFANYVEKEMRIAVAKNPSTPVKVLVKLANDDEYDVRRAIVCNTTLEFNSERENNEAISRSCMFPEESDLGD